MKFALYIGRHILAVALATLIAAIGWTVIYTALLLFAIVAGKPLGSPVSYPMMLIFLMIGILFVGCLVFAPACAFGRLFVGITGLPYFAAIPVVFLAGGLLSYISYYFYIEAVTTHPMPPIVTVFLNYGICLSIPLGVYWWLTDGPFAIVDGLRRWIRGRFIPRPSGRSNKSVGVSQ